MFSSMKGIQFDKFIHTTTEKNIYFCNPGGGHSGGFRFFFEARDRKL